MHIPTPLSKVAISWRAGQKEKDSVGMLTAISWGQFNQTTTSVKTSIGIGYTSNVGDAHEVFPHWSEKK